MIALGKRWRLHEEGSDVWVETAEEEPMAILDPPHTFGGPDSEAIEDLRLASSAPEGLELAERVLELAEELEGRDFGTHVALKRAAWADLCERAKELRLKARGF